MPEYKFVLAPSTSPDPPDDPLITTDDLIGIQAPALPAEFLATPYSYGAVGDGVTDDTAAMQEWLDAIAGGAGFGKTGTFGVSSTLYISSNTTIIGAGVGNFIIQALPDFPFSTSAPLLINRDFAGSGAKVCNNIVITGTCFQGSSTSEVGPTGQMVAMGAVEGLTYRNCKFQHWRRHLTTYANCNNVLVDGCEFYDWGSLTPATDPATYDGGYAMWFGVLDTNVRVINCYVHDGQWSGMHLGTPSTYVSIEGNLFENMMECNLFGGLSFAKIANNTFHGVTLKAISAHNIELGAESNNVAITGNTFNSAGLANLYLTNNFVITVTGNTFNTANQSFAPGQAGSPGSLSMLNSTFWTQKMDRVTVTGNTFTDGTGRSSYGIYISDNVGGITNTLIADNNLGPLSQWVTAPVLCPDSACGAGFMIRDNNCAPDSDRSCVTAVFVIPAGTTGAFTVGGVGFQPQRIQFEAVLNSSSTASGNSLGQQGTTYTWDVPSSTITAARAILRSSGMMWAANGTAGFSRDINDECSICIREPDGTPICSAHVTAVNLDGFTLTILSTVDLAVDGGGTGYAAGDVGTITSGDNLGTYRILAESGGVATSVMYTGGGSGIVNGSGVATTATTGGGASMTLDIAVAGDPTAEAIVVNAICHA